MQTKTIRIRDVPDEVHATLRSHVAGAGRSLSNCASSAGCQRTKTSTLRTCWTWRSSARREASSCEAR